MSAIADNCKPSSSTYHIVAENYTDETHWAFGVGYGLCVSFAHSCPTHKRHLQRPLPEHRQGHCSEFRLAYDHNDGERRLQRNIANRWHSGRSEERRVGKECR